MRKTMRVGPIVAIFVMALFVTTIQGISVSALELNLSPITNLAKKTIQKPLDSARVFDTTNSGTADSVATPNGETQVVPAQVITDLAEPTTPLLETLDNSTPIHPPLSTIPTLLSNPILNSPKPKASESLNQSKSTTRPTLELTTANTTNTTPEDTSPFAAIGRFFGNFLPSSTVTAIKNFAADQNFMQYVVSLVILLTMLVFIFGLNYASGRGWFQFVTNGNGRLAELAATHDLNQLAILTTTVIGFIVIITYLVLV